MFDGCDDAVVLVTYLSPEIWLLCIKHLPVQCTGVPLYWVHELIYDTVWELHDPFNSMFHLVTHCTYHYTPRPCHIIYLFTIPHILYPSPITSSNPSHHNAPRSSPHTRIFLLTPLCRILLCSHFGSWHSRTCYTHHITLTSHHSYAGPVNSGITRSVSMAATQYNIPQISYASTSDIFSDKVCMRVKCMEQAKEYCNRHQLYTLHHITHRHSSGWVPHILTCHSRCHQWEHCSSSIYGEYGLEESGCSTWYGYFWSERLRSI